MRVPDFIVRRLNLIRSRAPVELQPDLDEVISWARDKAYIQVWKKRGIVYDDYQATFEDGMYRVIDTNGDVEYIEAGNTHDAITAVMEARRLRRKL